MIARLRHPVHHLGLRERDAVDNGITAVEIADLELAAPTLWIVLDAGQQFVDRLHGVCPKVQSPPI